MRTATKYPWAGRARHRSFLRATIAAVLVAAVAITGVSGPADATDISIPFDDLVFGQPGSTVDIATVDVSAEMVGRTCDLAVLAENQSSVHPGNDLIVSTGSSQAVIFGVEDTPNGGTSETYEIVVGPTILVQLRIGQDGMSSLGFDLSFDCNEPVQETTTSTIAQQQLVSTTTVPAAVDCATDAAGQTSTTTAGTADGQAGSVTEGCSPDCSDAGGATDAGGASTTAVGQATTDTTVCGSAQVTSATTSTTAVTPTVAGSSTNQLPETPAAQAVTGSPSYTG